MNKHDHILTIYLFENYLQDSQFPMFAVHINSSHFNDFLSSISSVRGFRTTVDHEIITWNSQTT